MKYSTRRAPCPVAFNVLKGRHKKKADFRTCFSQKEKARLKKGMASEWPSWKVIELAKEELQILETQHPNRFDYLKHELKSFIFVESQKLNDINASPPRCQSTATTQGSTTRKRKMGTDSVDKIGKASERKFQKKRDRVDVVLQRAQACLHKIRDLKTNFF